MEIRLTVMREMQLRICARPQRCTGKKVLAFAPSDLQGAWLRDVEAAGKFEDWL